MEKWIEFALRGARKLDNRAIMAHPIRSHSFLENLKLVR
jgi:hypothetical protein